MIGELTKSHVTTGYGGIAAVLVAAYLAGVVYHGHSQDLVNQLASESGFLKWGIALVILWVIIQETGNELGLSIAVLAFLAMALVAGNKVFPQIAEFFKG